MRTTKIRIIMNISWRAASGFWVEEKTTKEIDPQLSGGRVAAALVMVGGGGSGGRQGGGQSGGHFVCGSEL